MQKMIEFNMNKMTTTRAFSVLVLLGFVGFFCVSFWVTAFAQDAHIRYENREDSAYQLSSETQFSLGTGEELPSATAVLQPESTAVISSQLRGRVVELPFKKGAFFKEGDVLVGFQCDIEQARLEKAKARYNAAFTNYKAHEKLNKLRSVASLDAKMAKSESDQAFADLDEQKARVEQCKIKAPFDGAVVDWMTNMYETVDEGQDLIRIISMADLEVKMLIPSNWLTWVEQGKAIVLEVNENGQTYDATIARINAEVDPVSRLVEVTAVLNNNDRLLRPGMTGMAYFLKQDAHPEPAVKDLTPRPDMPRQQPLTPDYMMPDDIEKHFKGKGGMNDQTPPEADIEKAEDVIDLNPVAAHEKIITPAFEGLQFEWLHKDDAAPQSKPAPSFEGQQANLDISLPVIP